VADRGLRRRRHAVLVSWLFLGEIPTVAVLLGGAVGAVGVAVSRLGGARPAPSAR